MNIQSELALENKLIEDLVMGGYKRVHIENFTDLHQNLKKQIEIRHSIKLSNFEFDKILTHLDSGTIFDRAKKLRDKYELRRDNDDLVYIEFLNQKQWCKNEFQVTNQFRDETNKKTRYDVTVLINGLPLVHIELKRRGKELKEAWNQIIRYHQQSLTGLFRYVQIFVVSNGVNTKYFSNNRIKNVKQTFNWTDVDNNKYNELAEFTKTFLEKCHLAKMITKYMVLQETTNSLMILRPYQFYAAERILKQVEDYPGKNGYIWHTTGSGKTLTSFKASQLIDELDYVDKVVFCVDRKDLDKQTVKEFDAFSSGAFSGTKNTNDLIKRITDTKTSLIITTMQKLNNAVSNPRHLSQMDKAKDKRIVFIFDECHRSQFGDSHKKINEFFNNKQFFGFTGTPIFKDNAIKQNFTTTKLFGEELHQYIIKDAIADDNVLGFSVRYVSTFKDSRFLDVNGSDKHYNDIQVQNIDKSEVFNSPERLNNVVDYIIEHHEEFTYKKEFTSIFAVSSVATLIKYYDIFKSKSHNLNIATIFSYAANPDLDNCDEVDVENFNENNIHPKEKLQEYINDYNKAHDCNFDLSKEGGYNAYFTDISERVKQQKVDILLVVNMFLTGFDSKHINTLYADKNLQYHGLIQAYSRTNRIINQKKRHGLIVNFRNLKEKTDEAIKLFSNPDAISTVLMRPYDEYLDDATEAINKLLAMGVSPSEVDSIESDGEQLAFIKLFRNVMRQINILETFAEFNYRDLQINQQKYEDYKGAYLDLHEKSKNIITTEKVSIIDEVDFEMELLRVDNINVDYILSLLMDLDFSSESYDKDKEFILRKVNTSESLRSKKDLIEKFINENMCNKQHDVEMALVEFLDIEKVNELKKLIIENNLKEEKIQEIISDLEYTNKINKDLIRESFNEKYGLSERRKKSNMLETLLREFVNRFRW